MMLKTAQMMLKASSAQVRHTSERFRAMATIQTIERKKGRGYRVVYRNKDTGKMASRIFDDEDKAKTFKDFLEANGASLKAAVEVKRMHDKRMPKVREIVAKHIDQLTKPQSGTIKRYRNHAKGHIDESNFGNLAIDKVTKQHVIEWMQGLRATKGSNIREGSELSQRTKKNIHALVSSAFETAVEAGTMDKNPAKGIGDPDTGEAREAVYLSPEDLEIIEDAMPERYQLFIRVLSKTGLRYNEATALRKRDIRIEDKRCIIMVTRAWKSTTEGEKIGPPKTKMAKRNVTCSLALSADLIKHMEDMRPGELLFTRPNGEFLRNSYFHKYTWQPVINKLVEDGDLDEKPWIHEIRKAHTTHLLQKGVAVNVVQARLGHEDSATTLKIYARLANDDDQKAADALD